MMTKKLSLLLVGAAFALVRPAVAQFSTMVRIQVPTEDARVYFDDTLTQQQGLDRLYQSPAEGLDPNKLYHYNIRVEAFHQGQLVDKVLTVDFHAGDYLNVAFNWQLNAKKQGMELVGSYNVVAAPPAQPVESSCGTSYNGCGSYGCGSSYPSSYEYSYPSSSEYSYPSSGYYGGYRYNRGYRGYRGFGRGGRR